MCLYLQSLAGILIRIVLNLLVIWGELTTFLYWFCMLWIVCHSSYLNFPLFHSWVFYSLSTQIVSLESYLWNSFVYCWITNYIIFLILLPTWSLPVFRNTIYFLCIGLVSVNLQNSPIGSKTLLYILWNFLGRISCHLQTGTVLFLPFLSVCFLFLFRVFFIICFHQHL
jgi:hypothetical protein